MWHGPREADQRCCHRPTALPTAVPEPRSGAAAAAPACFPSPSALQLHLVVVANPLATSFLLLSATCFASGLRIIVFWRVLDDSTTFSMRR